MKTSFFLPLLFLFQGCHSQPEQPLKSNNNNQTLLWEISGKNLKKPSYLFGTFHMLCRDEIKFSNNLLMALQNAEEVYFEMDLDDPSNTLGVLFFMNMKNNQTLQNLYTEEEYRKLQLFFKDSLKTSLTAFQKMKPSFLEAFLIPKMLPCKNMSGVEQELLKIAIKNKKEVKGFETIAFQAAVFDSIPYSHQAKNLLKSIDSIHQYKIYFDSMIQVYQSQQLDRMEALITDSAFGIKEGFEWLLDKRNINWVNQLAGIIPNKNIFIAVGAGHLVGKKGLIELLKKEGYTLRPLSNKQ
jgi:uncharacterized protein YbaP (TraB family)